LRNRPVYKTNSLVTFGGHAVGHSSNMDTEGTYSHKKTGDKEKAADFTDSTFNEILNSQEALSVYCLVYCK